MLLGLFFDTTTSVKNACLFPLSCVNKGNKSPCGNIEPVTKSFDLQYHHLVFVMEKDMDYKHQLNQINHKQIHTYRTNFRCRYWI